MNLVRWMAISYSLALLSGCATQSWQHTRLTDPAAAANQLIADDSHCSLVAIGAAPMPAIQHVPQPTTTTISGHVQSYNTTTGQSSYGTYSGTATTSPSGGFAGGLASGMASGASIGAAFAAQRAQERIHKACMSNKGWVEVPAGSSIVATSKRPVQSSATRTTFSVVSSSQIYETPEAEWVADIQEFFLFYPAYSKLGPLRDHLDKAVREIATSQSSLSGPKILRLAHKTLLEQAGSAPEPSGKLGNYIDFYKNAVDGVALDQAVFASFYVLGVDGFIPKEFARAAYWSQKSALANNQFGLVTYGSLVFHGQGIKANRIDGYRWVERAAATDPDAKKLLGQFKSVMTEDELKFLR